MSKDLSLFLSSHISSPVCCNKGTVSNMLTVSVSTYWYVTVLSSGSFITLKQKADYLFIALLMLSYAWKKKNKEGTSSKFVFMYHTQICAASSKGKELVCTKIALKWGRGPPKKPYFFLPTQPLFWQGWENSVFIYGAVCCGFSTITEWQCIDWEAC